MKFKAFMIATALALLSPVISSARPLVGDEALTECHRAWFAHDWLSVSITCAEHADEADHNSAASTYNSIEVTDAPTTPKARREGTAAEFISSAMYRARAAIGYFKLGETRYAQERGKALTDITIASHYADKEQAKRVTDLMSLIASGRFVRRGLGSPLIAKDDPF